jgi:hypothetical protein
MFDLPSKSDIEKISLSLLKQSKSLDVFPTAVDQIIKYGNLVVANNVDLSKIDRSFLNRLSDSMANKFKEAMGLVRGILDRRDKIIYLDLSQPTSRKNFVKLHEQGHDILPWQRKIFEYVEDDQTLDPETLEEFEAEANYFASTTLFQVDRFEHDMEKLELGIKSAMHLAKKFGSSNHAAIRKYVECSKNRCGLIVLENCSKKGESPRCGLRNLFTSQKFHETFGTIQLPQTFGFTWEFAQDYYFGKKYHERGLVTLTTDDGDADFTYHFFNNTHNAFVFIFPHGEVKKSKSKIIVSRY